MNFKEARKKSCACIYRILFSNGKSYIGKTKDLGSRMKIYETNYLTKGFSNCIGSAFEEYTLDDILVEILAEPKNLSRVDLNLALSILEIKYIREFNTISPNGYNTSIGGEILGIPIDAISTDRVVKYTCGDKPVLCYDLDGNFIQEFDSIEKCAYHFGVSATTVGASLNSRRELFYGKYMLRLKRYGVIPEKILPFKREVVEKKIVNTIVEEKIVVKEKTVTIKHPVLKYNADGEFCGEYDTATDAALSIGRKSITKGILIGNYIFFDYDGGEIKQNIGKVARKDKRLPKYSEALDLMSDTENVSSYKRGWKSLINNFKIGQYSLDGELIRTYDSIKDASYMTDIRYSQIWANVFGKTRRCNCYIFRKIEE